MAYGSGAALLKESGSICFVSFVRSSWRSPASPSENRMPKPARGSYSRVKDRIVDTNGLTG